VGSAACNCRTLTVASARNRRLEFPGSIICVSNSASSRVAEDLHPLRRCRTLYIDWSTVSPAIEASAVPASSSGSSTDGPQPTLLLIDGHSIAFRAFFALPVDNFKTTSGQSTNAVYGFTSMLINLLRDEKPTHIAAAFDVSRQTFRAERFPDYKANRSKTPDEFAGQVDITTDVLGAMGIPVMAEAGFEADDIIATLVTQAEALGYRVLVVTGDRDSLQLVTENVTVLYPKKGVSELTRFTPEEVTTKYGLSPSQYPDFAALRGDPSDNLPGIPGVGERQGRRRATGQLVLGRSQPRTHRDGARCPPALHTGPARACAMGPREDSRPVRRSRVPCIA
jgi:hypothetical protein